LPSTFWSPSLSRGCDRLLDEPLHSRPTLDKAGAPRHDMCAVTRALRFLALFSALFVVTVRCLGGFPLAAACAALPAVGVAEVCPADEPRDEDDTLAPVAMDDADDGSDAVIAPAEPRIRLLTHGRPSGDVCGALAAARALPSHAPSLDRPPRV